VFVSETCDVAICGVVRVRTCEQDYAGGRLIDVLRTLLLMLAAIGCGLGATYLIRAALVDVGGFTVGSQTSAHQLRRLAAKRSFWAGGALIFVLLILSLDLYGSQDLSKVVPLYSLSYVLVALIGQVFLDERVTLRRWIAIVTIVAGVLVLLWS
jgi:drug/metabolite transporter (DMT)-like permease